MIIDTKKMPLTSDITADAKQIIDSCQKNGIPCHKCSIGSTQLALGKKRITEELIGKRKVMARIDEKTALGSDDRYGVASLYQPVLILQILQFPDILNSLSSQSPILSWTHYVSS